MPLILCVVVGVGGIFFDETFNRFGEECFCAIFHPNRFRNKNPSGFVARTRAQVLCDEDKREIR